MIAPNWRSDGDNYGDTSEHDSAPWWERLDDAVWQGEWFDGASYWVGYAVCVLAFSLLAMHILTDH